MLNQQWLLAQRPEGNIRPTDFIWNEIELKEPQTDQILVRNIYLSLDPTNRGWMADVEGYLPPVPIGGVMRGIAIGVVEASRNDRFPEGSLVQGMLGWQKYTITDGKGLNILPNMPGIPLTAHFGLFGHIGMTAYFGLLEIGKPSAGETITITAASGAVGSLAGQIGKLKGCKVVGITGSDEKCHWITEELGFDSAINYQTESVYQQLKTHCPDGIDVIFENVRGKIFDAELAHINLHARVILCGLIAQYNATEPVPGPYNFRNLLTRRGKLEGFIVLDYMDRAMEAMMELAQWYQEGKIQYHVDMVEGLEEAPEAINRLFDGNKKGKLILKVSDEP